MKRTLASLLVLFLLLLPLGACGEGSAAAPETAAEYTALPAGSGLTIPIDAVTSTATYYPLTVNGVRLEVLAVIAPDGTLRTAFNTCQVCNGSPYAYFVQDGSALTCQNCGNQFPLSAVGKAAGGCNPVPILASERTETANSITIPYELLAANAYRFPSNWKTA
ncbi:MAG: DUF2318 domain-containing protein [Oscillospiraceae bacterium]|jgi:hypothetical protein|nr:DUF2318 domain-containing protein [Oscillospiraceae bacterium]